MRLRRKTFRRSQATLSVQSVSTPTMKVTILWSLKRHSLGCSPAIFAVDIPGSATCTIALSHDKAHQYGCCVFIDFACLYNSTQTILSSPGDGILVSEQFAHVLRPGSRRDLLSNPVYQPTAWEEPATVHITLPSCCESQLSNVFYSLNIPIVSHDKYFNLKTCYGAAALWLVWEPSKAHNPVQRTIYWALPAVLVVAGYNSESMAHCLFGLVDTVGVKKETAHTLLHPPGETSVLFPGNCRFVVIGFFVVDLMSRFLFHQPPKKSGSPGKSSTMWQRKQFITRL